MKKNDFIEFDCICDNCIKKVFIKDLSMYCGITLEKDDYWNKGKYRIILYYSRYYKDVDGYYSFDRESDYFTFDDFDKATDIYNLISSKLKES